MHKIQYFSRGLRFPILLDLEAYRRTDTYSISGLRTEHFLVTRLSSDNLDIKYFQKHNQTCDEKCSSILENVKEIQRRATNIDIDSSINVEDDVDELELTTNCFNTTEPSPHEFCVEAPNVFCEDTSGGVGRPTETQQQPGSQTRVPDSSIHTVVLKWKVRRNPLLGSDTPINIPFVFILEGKEVSSLNPQWKTYFKVRERS